MFKFTVFRPLENIFVRDSGCQILEVLGLFWIFFGTANVLEKIPFFTFVAELLLNSKFLTINFFGYSIYDCPLFGSLLCNKTAFQFCQENLNNRPSQQVTVGPKWSWMSFRKLPHLLNTLWPIVVTSDHFPVL